MGLCRFIGVATLIAGVTALVLTIGPRAVPAPVPPRFDEPGAAARHDLERRRPADARLDMPQLYETATRRIASLARFSSALAATEFHSLSPPWDHSADTPGPLIPHPGALALA